MLKNGRKKLSYSDEDRLKDLMVLALNGNSAAYRELLEELSDLLKAYFVKRLFENRAEADDLVQEALLAIHTRRLTYDRQRAILPWVYAIARYKLVDHLRKNGRTATVPLDEDILYQDDAKLTDNRIDLDNMLSGVPERTAVLIRKVKIEGQSIDDVARTNGMSQSAVKVAIHRGLTLIARKFGRRSHD